MEASGGKQRVTCLEEQKLKRFWRAPSQQYQTEVNNCLGGKGLPAEPQRKCAACRLEKELQVLCCNLCTFTHTGGWGLLVVQLLLLFVSSLLLVNNLSFILLLAIPVKPHWYARINRYIIVALVWDGFPFWINRRVSCIPPEVCHAALP